ncbi:MAG: ABC-F family ATP-binding cassette domain-containing protein [Clostridiales bacterium]|nr:ABC-F family ATP-binding cassette domain-containing protein [Clostridiales bacterium]
MILSCSHIKKSFQGEDILKDVSFHINEREKAALVGINGCGKSTIFKMLVKEYEPDSGEIVFAKDCTVGYLAQHQDITSDETIYDEVAKAKQHLIELERTIRRLEAEMKESSGTELEQKMKQYTDAVHLYERENGYAYRSELTGILKGLGFSEEEFSRPVSSLSGGQKTRLCLGKLLLTVPDLILLDEPTNHLDMESIHWLESYLVTYPKAVLIISHDRYFLDRIVTKVVSIEHHTARTYEGNYTQFSQKREQIRIQEQREYENQQRTMKHQEEVIEKLRSFNREKSIKRAESRVKMLDKMEVIKKPQEDSGSMRISFDPQIISGNDVLHVEDLSKSFDRNVLFSNLSFDIKRGERVAIIGNNGTGKTTLLKILNGQLPADHGLFRLGSNVTIGYYDQEHQVLDQNKTIIEELQDAYPDLGNTRIRTILAAFLFTEDDVFKQIGSLSGGEKGRVSLAKLMLSKANFLILDEPTNHLDMVSKEILERALTSYTGTVLYVSHDRYFINQTATRILELTHQTFLNYLGNYDYYLEKKDTLIQTIPEENTSASPASHTTESSTKADWKQQKEQQAKERKRENDLKKCEKEIEELEKRNEEIDQLLSQADIYSNLSKLSDLGNEKKANEERLEQLMELWETLIS